MKSFQSQIPEPDFNGGTTDVDVYYLTELPELSKEQQIKAEHCLDHKERQRYEKMVRPIQKKMFLVARYVTKNLLATHLKCEPKDVLFQYSANGKPKLIVDKGVHFNLSHSGSSLALAISSQNVGVDIESFTTLQRLLDTPELYINQDAASEIKKQSSKWHKAYVAARYWTTLEALVKLKDSSVFKLRNGLTLKNIKPDLSTDEFALDAHKASYKLLNYRMLVTAVSECLSPNYRYFQIRMFD